MPTTTGAGLPAACRSWTAWCRYHPPEYDGASWKTFCPSNVYSTGSGAAGRSSGK
jgi:hypothetical protein